MNLIDSIFTTQSTGNTSAPKKAETEQAKPEVKKDGKKKILLGMAATAAVAAAGIAITAKTGKTNKAAETVKDLGDDVIKVVKEEAGDDVAKAAKTAAKEAKPIKFKAAERLVSDEANKIASTARTAKIDSLRSKKEKWLEIAENCKSNAAKDYATRKAEAIKYEMDSMPLTPKQVLNWKKLTKLRMHIVDSDLIERGLINGSTTPEEVQGLLRQTEAATGKPCKSVSQALVNLAAM